MRWSVSQCLAKQAIQVVRTGGELLHVRSECRSVIHCSTGCIADRLACAAKARCMSDIWLDLVVFEDILGADTTGVSTISMLRSHTCLYMCVRMCVATAAAEPHATTSRTTAMQNVLSPLLLCMQLLTCLPNSA